MPGMAATVGSLTAHGGTVIGPGNPRIIINGKFAVCVCHTHLCPACSPNPHAGGPVTGPGVPNVLLGGMPAATMNDLCVCASCPSFIVLGSPNVFIGTGGGGGSPGGKAVSEKAQTIKSLLSGDIKPVKGTEALPIEIQAEILMLAGELSPEQFQEIIKAKEEEAKIKRLTIKDIVDILKQIEKESGLETARFCASRLNYSRLCGMTRVYIEGEDANPENDPNIMPTRFLILYGADDGKLREIDVHPDLIGKAKHNITVKNLRQCLWLLGYDILPTGPYDDEVMAAHHQYIAANLHGYESSSAKKYIVKEGDILGGIANQFRLPSWKYLYELNKDKIGENPDLLKPGTELAIPQWDDTTLDDKIAAKGVDPWDYVGGFYFYPCVPFSFTGCNEAGDLLGEKIQDGKRLPVFNSPKKFMIRDGRSGNVFASGEANASDELELMIPASEAVEVVLDGVTFHW